MDYATLTGINSINGVPEAHFRVQIPASSQPDNPNGVASAPYEEVIRVQPGHRFRIGRFEGRLIAVYEEDALIVLESSPVSGLHERPEENMIPADDSTPSDSTSETAASLANTTKIADADSTQTTNSTVNVATDSPPTTAIANSTTSSGATQPLTEQWLLSVGERLVDAFALAGVE